VQSTFGGGGDVFVTKLSSDGQSLIYSTYLGGKNAEFGQGIALDSNDNAYVTGRTLSSDFPTKNPLQAQLKGGQNAFVTELSADGRSLVYSTYFGGSSMDAGGGVAVDASGSVYISGFTGSSDFPTKNALQGTLRGSSDAFVTKLATDGQSLIYSTYLGGSGTDGSIVNGLAVDAFGNAYVASGTSSTDFPTKNALQSTLNGPTDIFVTKLSADGQSLIYSTYLGGSGSDGSLVTGLALDAAGAVYISSTSSSTDFPTKNPLQANNHGGNDAVIVKIADSAAQMLNISTRMEVLGGDQVLIAGFIVTGNDPKNVIIRGIGPSLNGVGVALSDPTLELHQGRTTLATNDNWKVSDQTGQSQEADIRATTIPPANDLESALVATLAPGNYTAILAGRNGGTGVGLVEVYDLAQAANSKLANISSRGFVDTGDNVMIGGFIVGGGTGGSTSTAKVIMRALGPSLPVAGALSDPTLELRDGSGTLISSNDNWKTRPDGSSQQAEIEATTIPPTNNLESAVVATLVPGNYTAIVRGNGNTTGVGLVEVYHLQ
jgi:hypothetical protein